MAITLSKVAKRANHQHLPHFQDLTRVGTFVTLNTSCWEITLREVIGRRGLIRVIAPTIVHRLLDSLKSLRHLNMVNQRICPENIGMTRDGRRLVHLELSDMSEPKRPWCQQAYSSTAYTKRVLSSEFGYSRTGFYQDRYSVGATILELLVGSDVLLQAERPCQMENLLEFCQPYIDETLHGLLQDLLFDGAHVSYDQFALDLCVLEPQRITESATRLDVAVNEDGKLQEIVSAFRDRREQRFGELEERY